MLASRLQQSVCLSGRLRLLARVDGNCTVQPAKRLLNQAKASTQIRFVNQKSFFHDEAADSKTPEATNQASETFSNQPPPSPYPTWYSIEERVRKARQFFGDTLPRDHLNDEELKIYERLYGTPLFTLSESERAGRDLEKEAVELEGGRDGEQVAHDLLRRTADGQLEVVEYDVGDFEEDIPEDEITDGHRETEDTYPQEEEDFGEEVPTDPLRYRSDHTRTHPLTEAGRFTTFPQTIHLPRDALVKPTAQLLANSANKHLSETALRVFGGKGLPYSLATPKVPPGFRQMPVALGAGQVSMAPMESDVYLATIMPGAYASIMSTLVEVRKRLGSTWIKSLLEKKGGPLVLDAGAGGAGVVAWREVLQAEWERLKEEDPSLEGPTPYGKSTVLTGSETLRYRASRILEDTQFLPRLPEAVLPTEQTGPKSRKMYDVIFAPNTLWGIEEEYLRRKEVKKLWSLLNPEGGVLILIEKGLPRGFEIIADARALLLERYILSTDPTPTSTEETNDQSQPLPTQDRWLSQKETGMIVAPCTNHVACPLYKEPGENRGRKDFCHFTQRYIRPPYLQRIIGAKDRNHEDIQFSYLAVQRGRDQRMAEHDIYGDGVLQGDAATDAAFVGHGAAMEMPPISDVVYADEQDTEREPPPPPPPPTVNPLNFPRTLFPPLKRRGHVILDVCTPSGTLERWTVPKSFGKQAYRDARKAQWGDLWALGAKTRIRRNVRVGIGKADYEREKVLKKMRKQQGKQVFELGVDNEGNVLENDIKIKSNRMSGRKETRKEKRMHKELRKELEDDKWLGRQNVPDGLAEQLSNMDLTSGR